MIINRVNVEGLCHREELEKISFEGCEIFSKDFFLTLEDSSFCSEIIEAILATKVLTFKKLQFKDATAASLTLITEVNLLLEERDDARLIRLEEEVVSNPIIEIKGYADKENLQVKVIDCSFNLVKGKKIMGFITYLIKENTIKPSFGQESVEMEESYENIDVLQEFP